MTDALAALTADDPDGKVIDFELQDMSTEQATYFFAPLLYSAGAALLNPDNGLATGTLDGPAAVGAITDVKHWAAYADPNEDGKAFPDRRVALSWNGHWRYLEYAAALGNDLVVIPLPDLGLGTKSSQGSWAWAVGAGTARPEAAASLIDWLTNDANAAAMSAANGAAPGTKAALAASPLYGPGEPLQMFGDNLAHSCGGGPFTSACISVPRTITPAYATVTGSFATAILTVLQGGDPQQALSKAATTIDKSIALDNG
jgi:maltose-binding protein MalE